MSLSISLSPSGTLYAEIPGTPPHTVEIPFSLSGLSVLRWVLEAQNDAAAHRRTIGFAAAPTQAMVNAFLATHRCDPAPAGKTAAQIESRNAQLAARFGDLDLSSLDLDL